MNMPGFTGEVALNSRRLNRGAWSPTQMGPDLRPTTVLPALIGVDPVLENDKHQCYVDCVDANGEGNKRVCFQLCYFGPGGPK
jgi:hypothetical protein